MTPSLAQYPAEPRAERREAAASLYLAVALSLAIHAGIYFVGAHTVLHGPIDAATLGAASMDASWLVAVPPEELEKLPLSEPPPDQPPPPEPKPEPQPEPPPPPPVPPSVVLGIEESPWQTDNWIGFQEYLEHLARQAEQDQAALRLAAGGDRGKGDKPSDDASLPDPSSASGAQSATQRINAPPGPPTPLDPVNEPTPNEKPAPKADDPRPSEEPDPTPKPTPTPKPARTCSAASSAVPAWRCRHGFSRSPARA